MYPERFARCFLIFFHVLVVHFDGTKSQVQVSFSGDWVQAAQDELNRELKIQQELMKQHAADLWQAHTGQKPPETTSTERPHDIHFTVVTPAAPKPTTAVPEPIPPSPTDFIGVDLRAPRLPTKTVVSVRNEDGSWGQKKVYSGDVIFEDDFSRGPEIDNQKWSREVKMPANNGYGFVIYQESLKNSFVKDNLLHIKPTVLDDKTARQGWRYLENCTGVVETQECERRARSYEILPPVETALLTTINTMSFKYGRIDIRAKLPMGDWIVPEIKLEPRYKRTYGKYNSGLIQLAFARGNRRLMQDTNEIGNNHLEMGFEIGENPARTTRNTNPEGWGSGFHNYTLLWTPDNLKFQVDDIPAEALCPQGRKLYSALGIQIDPGRKANWDKGSNIAPFDKEFYLTIGLSVGGLKHFPDGSRSADGQTKPWGDQKAKALLTFWENRGQWLGSWERNNGEDSSLKIDYVRITAI